MRNSLQSYDFSRLSHAANLRKEIGTLLDLRMEEIPQTRSSPKGLRLGRFVFVNGHK
jgi:hypothetical protein